MGLPSLLALQGARYDAPVVKLRTFIALYISGIEIGRKFSIKIFSDCLIDSRGLVLALTSCCPHVLE